MLVRKLLKLIDKFKFNVNYVISTTNKIFGFENCEFTELMFVGLGTDLVDMVEGPCLRSHRLEACKYFFFSYRMLDG